MSGSPRRAWRAVPIASIATVCATMHTPAQGSNGLPSEAGAHRHPLNAYGAHLHARTSHGSTSSQLRLCSRAPKDWQAVVPWKEREEPGVRLWFVAKGGVARGCAGSRHGSRGLTLMSSTASCRARMSACDRSGRTSQRRSSLRPEGVTQWSS